MYQNNKKNPSVGTILFIIAMVVLLIITLIDNTSSHSCYLCGKTFTGAGHKVRVYGSTQRLCNSCYSTQKMLGNITRY